MSEQARLFTALILSALAIFLYNIFFIQPELEKAKKAKQQVDKQVQIEGLSQESLEKNIYGASPAKNFGEVKDKASSLVNNSLAKLENRVDLLENDHKLHSRVKIKTPALEGSINLKGAIFDDITLLNYNKTLNSEEKAVLLSPKNTDKTYFIKTGWIAGNNNITSPDQNSIWQLTSGSILTSNNPIELTWQSPEGVVFKKQVSVEGKYLLKVKEIIENTNFQTLNFFPYGLINRLREAKEEFYISHEGAIAVTDNLLEEVTYEEMIEESKFKYENVSGWLGLTDKYWLTAIIPEKSNSAKFDISFNYYNKNGQNRYQVDVLSGQYEVPLNGKIEYNNKIYLGSKKLELLDKYSENHNITLFDRAIDFGALYFLTKPIFISLTFFNSHIGNFGLSILLLTICIRLILFPLANKSYKSMAMMRKHAPEIEKLKKKHDSDRQKLSSEMMKYYKDHNINPMSGCLPILVQIPVFFALYKVLYVTIEMRHAPFYGWIKDLSAPDTTNLFNLFGLLDFTPPEFLPHIGVLPLLFSFTMYLQQKLSPPPADPTQKMVIKFMPWILLFIFAKFPAGLVLYWVWNNILSITQQYIITRNIEADKNS